MNKRQISNYGKVLFLVGFLILVVGSMGVGNFVSLGIGFGFVLLSFGLLSYGSRVGDKQ